MSKHPKHLYPKVWKLTEEKKRVVAAKTTRLRALRLVKEAADRDNATREIARIAAEKSVRNLDRSSAPQS